MTNSILLLVESRDVSRRLLGGGVTMFLRNSLMATASVVAMLGASGAMAADPYALPESSLPAVSAPNGKIAAFAGSIQGDSTLGATGSFSLPLAQQWGAQVDALFGSAAGGSYYGIGGHLFWRDPAKGLLGAYGSWVGWDASSLTAPVTFGGYFTAVQGATVGKLGIEGEAYFSRISLEGLAGYQFGTNTGFTGRATVGFYATDDLRLDVGVNYVQGPGASFNAGVEWQPIGTGLSVFADASVGSANAWSVLGGVRVFFGAGQKSLIQRHREDDPENLLPTDLFKIANGKVCPTDQGYYDDGAYCIGGPS